MKKSIYVSAALILLVGCRAQPLPQDQSVANTYFHPYGFAMTQQEWVSHGQNGKIVSYLKGGSLETIQYENGKKQGVAEWTYPYSGVVSKSCVYEEDRLLSETFHYENGAPQKRTEYISPSKESVMVWYMLGNPQAKETWQEGKLIEATYFDEQGSQESAVVSGRGERLEKFDRVLVAKEEYEEGTLTSRRQMHPNGQMASEVFFQQGKAEGIVKTFDPKGSLVLTETWAAGIKSGQRCEYVHGEMVSDVNYLRGLKQGQEKRYRQGQLVETIDWVEGKKFGPHKMYVNNEVVKTEYYYYDIPVSKMAFENMVL